MAGLNINQLSVTIVSAASLVSLALIILLGLGKQFESVALVWIRMARRISDEHKKRGKYSRPTVNRRRNPGELKTKARNSRPTNRIVPISVPTRSPNKSRQTNG